MLLTRKAKTAADEKRLPNATRFRSYFYLAQTARMCVTQDARPRAVVQAPCCVATTLPQRTQSGSFHLAAAPNP